MTEKQKCVCIYCQCKWESKIEKPKCPRCLTSLGDNKPPKILTKKEILRIMAEKRNKDRKQKYKDFKKREENKDGKEKAGSGVLEDKGTP